MPVLLAFFCNNNNNNNINNNKNNEGGKSCGEIYTKNHSHSSSDSAPAGEE